MDVASSAISNVVNTSFPHAAQEARRDALAKETIPQLLKVNHRQILLRALYLFKLKQLSKLIMINQ